MPKGYTVTNPPVKPQMALESPTSDGLVPSTGRPFESAPAATEAAKTPLVAPVLSRKFEVLADGSIRGVVTIEPEAAAQIISWAESAGESLEEFIPKTLNEAFNVYCSSAEV